MKRKNFKCVNSKLPSEYINNYLKIKNKRIEKIFISFVLLLVVNFLICFIATMLKKQITKFLNMLFIILLTIFIIFSIIIYFIITFKHIRCYDGAQCFKDIDFFQYNLGERSEVYKNKIYAINYTYKHNKDLKYIIKHFDFYELYNRKNFLERGIDLFGYLMNIFLAIAISIVTGTYSAYINGEKEMNIIIGFIYVTLLLGLILTKYIERGEFGSFSYNIDEYELNKLNHIINKLERKLSCNSQKYRVIELRQNMIIQLIEVWKKMSYRLKMKTSKMEIEQYIYSLYKLDLFKDFDNKKVIWKKIMIGKKECYFPKKKDSNGSFINFSSEYDKLEDIIIKFDMENMAYK